MPVKSLQLPNTHRIIQIHNVKKMRERNKTLLNYYYFFIFFKALSLFNIYISLYRVLNDVNLCSYWISLSLSLYEMKSRVIELVVSFL